MRTDGVLSSAQVLILEPSKVLQPAIVCVSEEDDSRTVQLQHVKPLKACGPPPPLSPLLPALPFERMFLQSATGSATRPQTQRPQRRNFTICRRVFV